METGARPRARAQTAQIESWEHTWGSGYGRVVESAIASVVQTATGVITLPASPSSSIYWLYLLTALLLAGWVYARGGGGRARPTWRGLARFVVPRHVLGHRSSAHDLAMFGINTVLHSLFFIVPLHSLSAFVATGAWGWLHAQAGPWTSPMEGGPLLVGATLLIFVVADLAFFISHRMLHRIPALWELHKVHHSAPVLNPLTVFRRHPGEILVEGVISGFMLGLAYGTIGWVAGVVVGGHTILGVNILLWVALLIGFNLQHSHVWLRFGPLEGLLISPAAHQIHHSDDPRHHDRNFGNLLSVWDRWAGTYLCPVQRPRELRFGLGPSNTDYRTVGRLYVLPIVRIFFGNARRNRGTDRS